MTLTVTHATNVAALDALRQLNATARTLSEPERITGPSPARSESGLPTSDLANRWQAAGLAALAEVTSPTLAQTRTEAMAAAQSSAPGLSTAPAEALFNLTLEAPRFMDFDVQAEAAQQARFAILQQAGTAMLSQLNQQGQSVLRQLA